MCPSESESDRKDENGLRDIVVFADLVKTEREREMMTTGDDEQKTNSINDEIWTYLHTNNTTT
jgi:hypothetical protein